MFKNTLCYLLKMNLPSGNFAKQKKKAQVLKAYELFHIEMLEMLHTSTLLIKYNLTGWALCCVVFPITCDDMDI